MNTLKIQKLMTEKCYQLAKELLEIHELIQDLDFSSFQQLEELLKMESKLMMSLALEIKADIYQRNQRYLQ